MERQQDTKWNEIVSGQAHDDDNDIVNIFFSESENNPISMIFFLCQCICVWRCNQMKKKNGKKKHAYGGDF